MRKVSDIQRLSLQMIRPGYQVLCIASHWKKYYIYIYSDQQLFIAIPIGGKYQQVNLNTVSVWLRMRSLRDLTGN